MVTPTFRRALTVAYLFDKVQECQEGLCTDCTATIRFYTG